MKKNSVIFTSFFVTSLFLLSGCNRGLKPVFCTTEARLCPDGSHVGRHPPTCEFDPCPGQTDAIPDDWETEITSKITFRYPASFDSEYIDPEEWPPKITVSEGVLICNNELYLMEDRWLCVKESVEGAAGSIYKTFTYGTNLNEQQSVEITFTLRFPQCGNYEEPEKSDCEKDQAELKLNEIIDQIVKSITIK